MKIKLNKEQIRKEMKRMRLSYDDIAWITKINRHTIVSAFSDSQTRTCLEEDEFVKILSEVWESV